MEEKLALRLMVKTARRRCENPHHHHKPMPW
jgi:hypothetical protein